MNAASLVLKLCNLGLVIGAAGLWASAGVDARPKDKDEQTLVGGAIWTQTLIPIGLIISAIVDERLDSFVHAYYLLAGWIVLGITGIMLLVGESRKFKKQSRTRLGVTLNTEPPQLRRSFDRIYFGIGVLLSIASIVTFADFVLNIMIE
ncbi:uncharacterized protein LOC123869517 [Maniola jurtina]|uniref:uncharacterized protein LOC123869517 n=1 Tax=Maniola jurtina TaxID=191418 RepID=UPI001E68DAD1|nr:uncharacterized protein LOC123869517 [Maniola jurtina]